MSVFGRHGTTPKRKEEIKVSLKELLKYPLEISEIRFDGDLVVCTGEEPLFTVNFLQDDLKDFLIESLNEKIWRDFGEILRWERRVTDPERGQPEVFYECPYCDYMAPPDLIEREEYEYYYCPCCGRQVDPPEELENLLHFFKRKEKSNSM